MEDWLQELFAWLPQGGSYYLLIAFISLFESIVGIGLLMPGSVLVVFAGFLAASGKGAILPLMGSAAFGALLGDLLSFWLGARLGAQLMRRPFLHKRRALVHRAEAFFATHGGKSVFMGRFTGPIRGFIPFVAGSSRMRALPFVLYTLISAILWGLCYPGLGYLGGASWQQVRRLTGQLSLAVTALVVLLILNGLFWKKLAPRLVDLGTRGWLRLRRQGERLLQGPTAQRLQRRYPLLWQFLADRFSLRKGAGLYLTTGLLFSALFAALFVGLTNAMHIREPLFRFDLWVYAEVSKLKHPVADAFFMAVTTLGSAGAVLMLALLALFWLMLYQRFFSATILAAGTLGGELLVFALKFVFDRPRPVPLLPHLEPFSASFPSAHAFVALVFYGLLTYMLLDHIRDWQSRAVLLFCGSFVALLIGFSRIYLGVHWLSDVLAGFALAAMWLTFLITASEIRRRYAGEFPWHSHWPPLQFPRGIRLVLLSLGIAAAIGGVTLLIRAQLLQMGWP
ncbi:bifunctional DedA family/phosphatase PAP2 family protein [Desulfuromonas sp. AOP6]|uniref:bifunctional DedA family/phosphatase PAP2 family protein n=1 Tax=Desulfuromonas sp. AOP6 TaxID=1566351 RepID=UPI0012782C2F|nr:bifunctional DedA family/phosphatase PAP2 family protein [Desulfuromonas sp. AOP6]BCA80245.1 hypothetical protein AOP6_2032 [Desulfuromonas sp. AOP6]